MTAIVLGGPAGISGPIRLDAAELTYILDKARLGPMPAVLGWAPALDTGKAVDTEGAVDRLIERGLVSSTGTTHRAVLRLLTTATAPRWTVDVRVIAHSDTASDRRLCLCSNDSGPIVWLEYSDGSVTVANAADDAASMLATALGNVRGDGFDSITDTTELIAERLPELIPHCTRHVEIVGLQHGAGLPLRIGPTLAIYDCQNRPTRLLATTSTDEDGRSWTTLSSGTRPRLISAVRSVLAALSPDAADHLVGDSDQPIGSSETRLPFVSNGGV